MRASPEFSYASPHPYLSDTDTYTPVCFPGAKRLTVTFSNSCRLEHGYDYVKFYKDSRHVETWHPSIKKFTGCDGSENFPGYDGRPPLVIEGDSFELYFHSDGSGEDWGWEFTVKVQYKSLWQARPIHWLVELEQNLVNMGATMAHDFLVAVPWQDDLESAVSPWLEAGFYSDTVKAEGGGGLTAAALTSSGDEGEALLKDLILRPRGSLAEQLAQKMKNKVPTDQGHIEAINEVVYGTCAVLIKVHSLTYEAVSVAKGNRKDLPRALVKLWANAQKMRTFFDYGDVKSKIPDGSNGGGICKLQRTYSGSSPDTIRQTSDAILVRIRYLLASNISDRIDEHRPAKQNWKTLAKITSSQMEEVKAKSTATDKFAAAALEVQNLHKLHSMMEFRRKIAADKPLVDSTPLLINFFSSNSIIDFNYTHLHHFLTGFSFRKDSQIPAVGCRCRGHRPRSHGS